MSKKGKKGASPHNGTTENARGVVVERKVGKGVPPKEHRWKPGQSGNPSGKASEAREVTVAVITAALAKVDPKLGKSALERIIEHSIRLALQGSFKDKKLLLAYGLGMPKQAMDVDVFNYTDALTAMRAAKELAAADHTIRQYFQSTPGLAAAAPTNGHSTPQDAQAAANLPDQDLSAAREDDAEQPTQPQPAIERGPIKRVVV